jgi:hypothetical protein
MIAASSGRPRSPLPIVSPSGFWAALSAGGIRGGVLSR